MELFDLAFEIIRTLPSLIKLFEVFAAKVRKRKQRQQKT